jgi:hypothetical protein
MTDQKERIFTDLVDLEYNIVQKIYTMIDAKWDAETLRRDIELLIMEHKRLGAEFSHSI